MSDNVATMVTLSNYGFDLFGTLIAPNGQSYELGDLGKWYGRRWGLDTSSYQAIAGAIHEDQPELTDAEIQAAVWLELAREEKGYDDDDQVYAALDNTEEWEMYA